MTESVTESSDRHYLMSVSGNNMCEYFPAHGNRIAVGWVDMDSPSKTDKPLACGECVDYHKVNGGKVLRDLRRI